MFVADDTNLGPCAKHLRVHALKQNESLPRRYGRVRPHVLT